MNEKIPKRIVSYINKLATAERAEHTRDILLKMLEADTTPHSDPSITREAEQAVFKIITAEIQDIYGKRRKPEFLPERIAKLKAIRSGRFGRFVNGAMTGIDFLIKSNLYAAVGAGFLCYASCGLQGITPLWSYILIAALYVFAMHTINRLSDEYADQIIDPYLPDFYSRWQKPLGVSVALAMLLALVLSFRLHLALFLLILLAGAAGALYRMRIVPGFLTSLIRYERLIDIPGSKELFLSVGWAVVTVLVPALAATGKLFAPGLWVTGIFAFGLVFIRGVLFDIRDIQRDEIVGRETIPIVLGEETTKRLLGWLALALVALLFISASCGWVSRLGYLMGWCVGYAVGYLYLYHLRAIAYGLACEAVADANFIFAGVLALIHRFLLV